MHGTWIEGCAFQIGDRVRVVERGHDVHMVAAFIGLEGEVEDLVFEGLGQRFPDDPFIGVRFPDGNRDGFWSEELDHTFCVLPPQLALFPPQRIFPRSYVDEQRDGIQ